MAEASHPNHVARPRVGARSDRGPKPTGQILEYRLGSGVVTYSMRLRWKGERLSVRLGNELEGWNRPLAEMKLAQTTAEIQAGVWRPPAPELDVDERDPRFHEFATAWIERQRVDLAPNTGLSYDHVLSRYILPEFKDLRLSEITHEAVLRWRDRLRRDAEQLKLAKENGVELIDKRGRPRRAFGAQTINEALRLLGQILERAVESEQYAVQRNPVKGRAGLRVKRQARPPREHLEADEVISMIQAADLLDQGVAPQSLERGRLARQLRASGLAWSKIANELGCAETTAIYLSRIRARPDAPRRRRAMIVVLALSGVRASEDIDLVWSRVDHTHGRIVLADSKSAAGVREVHLSPYARAELALYKASLLEPPAPDDPVFPVRGGGSGDRFNLGRRLKRIATVASELRERQGLAPMPARITPHTFRRTFITLSFQAGKDLVFVQSQAGHANWRTTLDIYTQQSGRTVDPQIRAALDALLGDANEATIARYTRRDILDRE